MTPFGGGRGSVPVDDPSKLIGMWSEELNRQASMIAYLNDFRVLAVAAVVFIPLFFMRRQARMRDRRAADTGSARVGLTLCRSAEPATDIRRHGTSLQGRATAAAAPSIWCARSLARISAWPPLSCWMRPVGPAPGSPRDGWPNAKAQRAASGADVVLN